MLTEGVLEPASRDPGRCSRIKAVEGGVGAVVNLVKINDGTAIKLIRRCVRLGLIVTVTAIKQRGRGEQ